MMRSGWRQSMVTVRFDLNVKLYTIKDYGGWNETYKNYFDDGAMFDEIYGNE